MDNLAKIEWTSETQSWPWPFTPEQRAQLTANHASSDGFVSVFCIGPDDVPDLIIACGPHDVTMYEGADDGDVWYVRFGLMRVEDYANLPEHEGW